MRKLPLLLSTAALLSAGLAAGGDWPQFRGPNRDGVAREPVLREWPKGGPRVLWQVPAGEGYSHVAVAGGRLFTMFGEGGDEALVCLDAATGKKLWRYRTDSKLENDMGNGPRSTPTVDAGVVYALSGLGKLHAVDAATGKKLWSHDLQAEYGGRPPNWGVSTSPLVEGKLLLVDAGGWPGKALLAFDKKSGKLAWATANDKAGYAAPIAITVAGVRQIVFFTGSSLIAVGPGTGKEYWRVPWRTDWDVNAATPLFVAPDKVYVSSGYDTGAGLFRVKVKDGRIGVEEVWRSKVMKNEFSSAVLQNGYVYGFDKSTLKCIDIQTGDEKWKQRGGLGHGSLILADGQLIVLTDRGRLMLVEATPQAYREKAAVDVLSGKSWTGPSLANGRLYLRNEEKLVALDVARPAERSGG